MIRIEELDSGILHVHYSTHAEYVNDPEKLDTAVRDKFYMLRAADEPTRIKGVGARVLNNSYWIFEDDNDESSYDGVSKLTKALLTTVATAYRKSYETDIRHTFARYGFVPPSKT